MKIRVVKELECMKSGLSYSDEESKEDLISVESRKCSHSLENNGKEDIRDVIGIERDERFCWE